jgi:signal transduction histidine kinase
MRGPQVQRTNDGLEHTARPAASQVRPHSVSHSHVPGSHPRPKIRRTDKRASPTQAAVLQERARIARELHDGVSQTLYAISLRASHARRLLQRNETKQGQHIIEEVLQFATAGQSEVRALLTDIRSDGLMFAGLVAALERLVTDVGPRNALDIRLSAAEEPDVPAPAREALVLIAREALHNVTKHSAACRVDIVLELQGAQLVMLITDDGRGFDPTTPRPGHFGLQTMRERAASTGGTLTLVSAVGRGTRLRVSVPLRVHTYG